MNTEEFLIFHLIDCLELFLQAISYLALMINLLTFVDNRLNCSMCTYFLYAVLIV